MRYKLYRARVKYVVEQKLERRNSGYYALGMPI
jgi:hypothetical protein